MLQDNEQEMDISIEFADESKKQYLEELSVRLEKDFRNINRGVEREEKIDPVYTREIALNVLVATESIRRIDSSPEMNQAFEKVSSLLDDAKNQSLDMYLELAQTRDLFLKELENNVDDRKVKMLHEILEGMRGEFDHVNPGKNNPTGMASVAYKLFIDIAEMRDNMSDNLKGIEGNALYLKRCSDDLAIDEVQIVVYKMLLRLGKELAEKEVDSN